MADMKQIKEYFGCEGRPVSPNEMMQFWKSLTDEEKHYYKVGVGQILGL